MTPAARQSAAIDILDRWLGGQAVEAALTQWARASRFAGSGDREAVRDLVFRAVRQRRSLAALGGGESGRALLLGMARADGQGIEGWTGQGHSPAPPTQAEAALLATAPAGLPRSVALDCPDWLLGLFDAALPGQADAVLERMRQRAPVFVRVNAARAGVAEVSAELARDGIATRPCPLAPHALEVTENARKLRGTPAFAQGRIELQDAASQAVAHRFAKAVGPGEALDYCAGGGGKALALAALGLRVSAHDANPGRMADLPARATRAGAAITVVKGAPRGQWRAILADAPCSGSGSWRRAPEAKWTFTPERLAELTRVQDDILQRCAALCAPGGVLGYATCSVLEAENEARVTAFLGRHPDWNPAGVLRLSPLDGGDGFFLALLQRT